MVSECNSVWFGPYVLCSDIHGDLNSVPWGVVFSWFATLCVKCLMLVKLHKLKTCNHMAGKLLAVLNCVCYHDKVTSIGNIGLS